MASILRQSSSFASNRIALVSQGASEDASGLVTVNAEYCTSAANNDYWASRFALNSVPPISPDIIDGGNLQRGSLYMGARSLSKENGLVNITATYYGALQSALTAKNKRTAMTTQTLDCKAFTATQNLRCTFRSNIIEYVVAVCENAQYAVTAPTIRDLFAGFISLQLTGSGSLSLSFTNQILADLIANQLITIYKEESSESLTPSVSVKTTRFSLATQTSST
jgi:hypothetical protein